MEDMEWEYRDVKTIFSYGDNEDVVYIQLLIGFLEWVKNILEMGLLEIGIISGFIYLNFNVSPKCFFLSIWTDPSQWWSWKWASNIVSNSNLQSNKCVDFDTHPKSNNVWCIVGTIPNIVFVVGVVSRFLPNLIRMHWELLKRVTWYFEQTLESRIGPWNDVHVCLYICLDAYDISMPTHICIVIHPWCIN